MKNEIKQLKKEYKDTLSEIEGLKLKLGSLFEKQKMGVASVTAFREKVKLLNENHIARRLEFVAEVATEAEYNTTKEAVRVASEALVEYENLSTAVQTVITTVEKNLKQADAIAAIQKKAIYRAEVETLVKKIQDQTANTIKRLWILNRLSLAGSFNPGGTRAYELFLTEIFPVDEKETSTLEQEIEKNILTEV